MVVGYFHDLTPKGQKVIRRKLCTLEEYDFGTIQNLWAKEFFRLQEDQKLQGTNFRHITSEYLKHVERTLSPTTLNEYNKSIVRFNNIVGNVPINEWDNEYADQFFERMKAEGLANATQRKHGTAINVFLKWANEKYPHNIYIKLPKRRKKRARKFHDNEVNAFFFHIWKRYRHQKDLSKKLNLWNHLRALYMLVETGMRRSEVWALLYDDIGEEEIFIRDNEELMFFVKGAEEQDVPISDRLAKFLRVDKKVTRKKFGIKKRQYYLCDFNGNLALRADSLTQAFLRHKEEAGIDSEAKILHGHRATMVTKLIDKFGVSEAQVIARHQSEQTTLGYFDKRQILKKRKKYLDNR